MQIESDQAAPATFGARLAAARKAAGMTQEQLGQGMGADGRDLGKGAVSCWENDVAPPNTKQLALLCERLKVKADDLLFGPKQRKAA